MKIRYILPLLPVCLTALLPLAAADQLPKGREAEAVIALARAHVGGEEALSRIHSLRYTGTIESPERNRTGRLTLYLKKPLKQRIEILTDDGMLEVTAVNGYEGWTMQRKDGEGNTSVQVMNAENLNRMLVSTWENLNFFRKPEEQLGKTLFKGATEHRGRLAYELRVVYPGGRPFFRRFFDRSTGELIASITDDGLEFVESGMIREQGLLFPRKVDAFRGTRRVHVIKFDQVEVNAAIDDSLFEFPSNLQGSKN